MYIIARGLAGTTDSGRAMWEISRSRNLYQDSVALY